jgi:hypothetical protein
MGKRLHSEPFHILSRFINIHVKTTKITVAASTLPMHTTVGETSFKVDKSAVIFQYRNDWRTVNNMELNGVRSIVG